MKEIQNYFLQTTFHHHFRPKSIIFCHILGVKHTQCEKEELPCFLYLIQIYLNRALKQISQLKLNLEARFKLVVKGMGDLKSFVTRDYPKYLSYVDDLKFPVKKWSDSRARDMSELLNRLIGKIILNICQKIVHSVPKFF